MRVGNKTFEMQQTLNSFTFISLGKTLENQNWMYDEIRSRLKSGNATYYSARKYFSFRLPFKNINIRIYCNFVFLHGFKTWSLTLRNENRLRVFENMVMRKTSKINREQARGDTIKLHNDELQ
jgi:hypothetical protein